MKKIYYLLFITILFSSSLFYTEQHVSAETQCAEYPTTAADYQCLSDEAEAKANAASSKANNAQQTADELAAEAAAMQAEIDRINKEIPETEAEISQTKEELAIMLQSMQIAKNSNTWIDFLMSATGPEDMMNRMAVTTNLQSAQQEKISLLKEQTEYLAQQQASLVVQEAELEKNIALLREEESSQAAIAAEEAEIERANQEYANWCSANPVECSESGPSVSFFMRPYPSGKVSHTYGVPSPDYGGEHYGMDLSKTGGSAAMHGTTLYAPASGKVVATNSNCNPSSSYGCGGGWGNYVYMTFNYEGQTIGVLYAHMAEVYVGIGDKVTSSTVVGTAGNSGSSESSHLHLEVHTCGSAASGTCPRSGRSNPSYYFDIVNQVGWTWGPR